MNKYETPINFDIRNKLDDCEISYFNLNEISQGGPVIGNIIVNGKKISSYKFGGPLLLVNDNIFIPVFSKKLFGNGFKLAVINKQSFKIEIFGRNEDVIFLDKVEGDKVYFFLDIDKTIYSSLKIK